MRFINRGEPKQVRQDDGLKVCKWKLLKKGETIDLPKDIGLRYGFEIITEGKIGKKKVETKQIEKKKDKTVDFYNELIKIGGIGTQTAEDVIVIFSKKSLIKAISNKEKLPFRDDVEKKLKKKYGKK